MRLVVTILGLLFTGLTAGAQEYGDLQVDSLVCEFNMGGEKHEVDAFGASIDASFMKKKYLVSVLADVGYYPQQANIRVMKLGKEQGKTLAQLNYESDNICKTSSIDGLLMVEKTELEYRCKIKCSLKEK